MHLLDDATSMADELTRLRHTLHAHPEVGLALPRTRETVLSALGGLPLEISCGERLSSVTGVLRGTHPDRPATGAPVVLLRGDMDALPVQEKTVLPYRSQVAGAMHACGHDLHTTMLAGAAQLLAAHADQLPGDVVFMFQPGEEACDGAAIMIEEGVLDVAGRRADAAYALHVFSAMVPQGKFVSRPGPMLAAADGLRVTVHGRGGHGSSPHTAVDPVTAVAEMITALQTMVTRRFDVFDPVVISVGSLHAGTAANVIPDVATFEATVRTFSAATRHRVALAAQELLRGIAAAHGAEVDVEHVEGYPVTHTDAAQTAFASATIQEVFGDGRYAELPQPLSGSEDFSHVLARVPGSFIGLGAAPRDGDPEKAPFNHSPRATFDDAVLPDGTALYAELAVRRLRSLIPSS
jgi:amidohydrolase